MPLILPKSIKIGCFVYQVKLDPTMTALNIFGQCDNKLKIISLEPNMNEQTMRECLLHEILHACCYILGYDDNQRPNEEDLVTRLSPILTLVLQENILDVWQKRKPKSPIKK